MVQQDKRVLMDGHWEHGTTQEEESSTKEWVVEYRVDVENISYHHLSLIEGKNLQIVQANLVAELREEYSHTERIDVTVIRMEPVETHAHEKDFDTAGAYHP